MDEKTEKILIEKLFALSEGQEKTLSSVAELDKKLEINITETRHELEKIHKLDDHQNRLLEEHIAGVKAVKELVMSHKKEWGEKIQSMDDRVVKIEEPRKALSLLIKIAAAVVVLNSFLSVILQALGKK